MSYDLNQLLSPKEVALARPGHPAKPRCCGEHWLGSSAGNMSIPTNDAVTGG